MTSVEALLLYLNKTEGFPPSFTLVPKENKTFILSATSWDNVLLFPRVSCGAQCGVQR